jgi:hypothetical protein
MKDARHFLTAQLRTKSSAPVLTQLTELETVSQFQLSSCPTENTLRLYYKVELVNAVC